MILDYLDFFEANNIGVVNASPFSMGLLTKRGAPAWHPAPEPLKEACSRATEHCAEKGYDIEKLAVQYSTSNPRIATTLFSSANPANVHKCIDYIKDPVDETLVKEVQEIIGDQMRVRWANT